MYHPVSAAGLLAWAALLSASGHALADDRLTSDRLEKLVTRYQIKTPEALLAKLPERERSDYALIYRTGSPHTADRVRPRAILFGRDASFILAFNGIDEQLEPYLTFDILEFNDATKAYDARALRFSPQGDRLAALDRHPETCLLCHKSYLGTQPVRRVYLSGVYPGIYGSIGDRLFGTERRWYDEYVAKSRRTGRYQYLKKRRPGANARLGRLLNRANFAGLAARIAATPALLRFRYALLAASECVTGDGTRWDADIRQYIPQRIRDGFRVELPVITASFAKTLANRREASLHRRELMLEEILDPSRIPAAVTDPAAAAAYYIVRNALTDQDPIRAEIGQMATDGDDGYGGFGNLAESIYAWALSGDAQLLERHRRFDQARRDPWSAFAIYDGAREKTCAQLKTLSLQALQAPIEGNQP